MCTVKSVTFAVFSFHIFLIVRCRDDVCCYSAVNFNPISQRLSIKQPHASSIQYRVQTKAEVNLRAGQT